MKQKLFLANTWVLAWILCVTAVTQLLDFEEFATIVQSYGITSQSGSVALAVCIIGLEVFALPYLLGLKLSRLASELSSLFVILAPLAWIILIGQELIGGDKKDISGLLGGYVNIPVGMASFVIVAFIFAMSLWSLFKMRNPPKWLGFVRSEAGKK
ncbi:MAG: hypothetical protein PVI21_01850 [Candidatus Woesebacteria bacterium]|jgi:hypothetical protein